MKNQLTVDAREEGGASFADVESQRYVGECEFAQGVGGSTDVSGGVNAASLTRGYSLRSMKGVEGSEMPLLYGDEDGFLPRNNYLDRSI